MGAQQDDRQERIVVVVRNETGGGGGGDDGPKAMRLEWWVIPALVVAGVLFSVFGK